MVSLMFAPLVQAVEWNIDQCSALDLLAGRTGIADVRPTNDPHLNTEQMVEQNSGIYRGQWSWQSEMPELLYEMMNTGEVTKVSPSGFTALQAACVYADEGIFQALLEAGVEVDARPADWQQLGYVGDTPLGLLVRFMTPRTAAARLRMARILLEKGADPDAPMTTWRGNRVVSVTPFCELGAQDYNHDMRILLAQAGEKDLAKRMSGWQLNWEWFRDDLVQHLTQNGLTRETEASRALAEKKAQVGRVPLLDLVRKGNVEGVRLALEAGVDIEVSARAKRYGQEPLFNIPVRRKDDPEAAVEIARLLIDAGSDMNALNRRGRSLRVHYNRYRTKASKALCAYLKERGAFIHPDSPMRKEEVAAEEKARQARIQARYRRLNGLPDEEAEKPVSEGQPQETPVAVAESTDSTSSKEQEPPAQSQEVPGQTVETSVPAELVPASSPTETVSAPTEVPSTQTESDSTPAAEASPAPQAEEKADSQLAPEQVQAQLTAMQNQLADLELKSESAQNPAETVQQEGESAPDTSEVVEEKPESPASSAEEVHQQTISEE